jgi:hypothetical protein
MDYLVRIWRVAERMRARRGRRQSRFCSSDMRELRAPIAAKKAADVDDNARGR